MEPPKAVPLQIPSEDDVPLFDPSGLSASLSADDWHNSFDLNSVAAARLGIGSPTSQNGSGSLSASIANLAHSNSHTRENTDSSSRPLQSSSISRTSSNDIALQSSLDNADDAAKRGRRRRSSAIQDTAQAQVHPTVLPQKDTSVGSKVRMWWERSAAGTPDVDTSDAPVVEREPPSETLPPLRIDAKVEAEASPSSSVRSPAADFLSAFSSLNSVVQPATSYDNRSISYSPPRSGHRSLGASLMHDDTRNGSAAPPSFGSLRGLGSAAAQLYETQLTTASASLPRSDDEGARVGPAGRYLLGKTIGVGGFSTVRQGWDLEAQGPADPTAPLIDGQRNGRRVAVKIVYHHHSHMSQAQENSSETRHHDLHSHELRIWKSLPTHQHLLPLLHHESLALDTAHSGQHQGANTTAELLIMPYCDQGNLLDFVRSEGGSGSVIFSPDGGLPSASHERRSASGSWAAPGSARSSTLLSRSSSLRTSMDDPSRRHPGSRTGSGFIKGRNAVPSHALGRVASVSAASQLHTIPAGQEASSVASSPVSAAGSMSSGSRLLRRTASQLPRSEGIPIDAARETMRQLASALSTLHTKCHILHGDLKLENVLGQDRTSWKKRQRTSTSGSHGGTHSRQNSGNLVDSVESLATSSVSSKHVLDMSDAVMPCWRIADFGLAQVLDPAHAKAGMAGAPALIRALKEEARISDSQGVQSRKKGHKSGRGGSLAYTAPEFLRAQGTPGTSSPAAVESAEESDLQPESPFAADMWALGCILYAMLSGKLPFTDSFEPRLQMKIAKAQWELPPRLRRRAERLTASSTSTLTSQVSPSDRTLSTDRSSSAGPTDANDRFAFSQQRRSVSGLPRGIASFGSMDLSASLPSLLPRERQMTEPATETMPVRAAVVHSDQVVGSAPGRADHLESFEINQVAKAKADVEEDPESDQDSDIDSGRDGLSWDRAAARQVLRGLLEPDPRRRWTIEKLCTSAWIRREGIDLTPSASPLQTKALVGDYFGGENDHRFAAPTTAKPSSSAKGFAAARDMTSAGMDEESPQIQHGRRSSSLARTRPSQVVLDSPASATSLVQSPTISADGGDSSKRRSRSTSRISIQYRDSSRNRSTDASGTSTPNRERDQAWAQHHLASSLQSQAHAWLHATAKERSDSPADSERRGRMPRSRMADLDENTTWNGEEGASSDSRSGSQEAASLRRVGPIAIRGRSQSRSRSRHSRESASPDRFGQRSTSRSRSTYSLSRDAGISTGILYGRSAEPQPTVGLVVADETQARRSSTARSRSRAPDALAQILDRQRSRSRSRIRDGGDGAQIDVTTSRSAFASGTANDSTIVSAAAEDGEVSTRDQEARGRSRDRR
ncbi:likely protein kinase [Pseudozyma hubeiensis SY62]|uniref:non-specific serine/threonine protein kinase n=1 Tax=Pseudozyma hubeiensis (strain SY62) TaxID=1305764 RepID=R9NZN8_PSEHS|nr:likely protein kinase [Pseudozyma hubeiensis SY62]GAC94202.1 likely protein kinase [Pseudozyma hubeiensis SY62]